MAFNVTAGCLISSIRYRIRREGKAKNRRIIAGRMVQMVSTSWASEIFKQVIEFIIRDIRA